MQLDWIELKWIEVNWIGFNDEKKHGSRWRSSQHLVFSISWSRNDEMGYQQQGEGRRKLREGQGNLPVCELKSETIHPSFNSSDNVSNQSRVQFHVEEAAGKETDTTRNGA